MSSADENMPDFDSMSPEELMAWMETLAERQGATEGFTTEERMEIDEVDPDSVDAESLGEYVPYGMDPEKWKAMQAEEEAQKTERQAATQQPDAEEEQPTEPEYVDAEEFDLPPLEAAAEEEETGTVGEDMSWLESLADESAEDIPEVDLSELEAGMQELEGLGSEASDPMDWLENLTQGEQSFEMPDFGAETTPPEEEQPAAVDEELPAAEEIAADEVVSPIESGANPVEWLESLARRQGADENEFVTEGNLDVPLPGDVKDEGPGYTDYTVEDEPLAEDAEMPELDLDMEEEEPADEAYAAADLDELDDPEAWLESLASGAASRPVSGDDEEEELEEIDEDHVGQVMEALNRGEEVDPDAIRGMMDRMFDRASDEEEDEDYDPDAPAVPIEIPDWLMEQVGSPPPMEAEEEDEQLEALDQAMEQMPDEVDAEMPDWLAEEGDEAEEEGEAAPATADMPDWLKADIEGEADEEVEVEDIFADVEEEAETPEPAAPVEAGIDYDDPWVQALKAEREEPEKLAQWYAQQVGDEAEAAEAATLQPADLPEETTLPEGEPEALPDWLDEAATAPAAPSAEEEVPDWLSAAEAEEEEAVPAEGLEWLSDVAPDEVLVGEDDEAEGLPDWLQDAEVEPEEVPDWLKETLDTGEQEVLSLSPEDTTPTPPVVTEEPAPPAEIDVAATLETARDRVKAGAVDEGLQAYEAVIRASAELETVVDELHSLSTDPQHQENPAILRVLGDGLMRQGRLQEALQTYQSALNLL